MTDSRGLPESAILFQHLNQLIMYDQIGCGKSYVENRPDLWNAETWVNELIALREYLGIEECHLLGQSWGGMLLLTYI